MDIKFLTQDNEVQKLYSQLGLVVPVGDLSTGKAPSIQPLPSTSTQTSVTVQFNVMSGADISALSYTVNDGEAQSITPSKGVVTVTLTDLEYNSGPYSIKLTATNETGSTNVTTTVALQHYTNWATPDEVLEGNKYIGEDGEEHVGEIETKDSTDLTVNERTVTVPAGYYAENASASVSSDYIIPTGSTSITTNGTDINIAQYAAVDVAVPASAVVSGTLPITANGTGIDVTNYASVDVNVPQGPTAGGATITSCQLNYTINPDDQSVSSSIAITFSEMPDWDFSNHLYNAFLYTTAPEYNCTDTDSFGSLLSSAECGYNSAVSDPQDWATPNVLEMYGNTFPVEPDPIGMNPPTPLASSQGYLVITEDYLWHQKWIIPCTITSTEIQSNL